jgi:hypothetical protein
MSKVQPAVLAAAMLSSPRAGAFGQDGGMAPAPLPRELRHVYEKAEYVVFSEPELVIRVGEPSAGLDALLASHEADTAAYLTAANPDGLPQSHEENLEAREELKQSSWIAGLPLYDGEGRDPQRQWKPEPSVLAVGITRDDAVAAGLGHARSAIVFIEKGKAPELVELV